MPQQTEVSKKAGSCFLILEFLRRPFRSCLLNLKRSNSYNEDQTQYADAEFDLLLEIFFINS